MLRATFEPYSGVHPSFTKDCPDARWGRGRRGYTDATLPVEFSPGEAAYVLGSQVTLFAGTKPVYFGTVTTPPQGKGIMDVGCAGDGFALGAEPVYRFYKHTFTSDWKERTFTNLVPYRELIRFQTDGPTFRFTGDGAIEADNYNGCFLRIPETASSKVQFTWNRPDTDWRITMFWGTYAYQDATGNEVSSWTGSHAVAAYGTGNLTGSYDHTIPDTHDIIMIRVQHGAGGTVTIEDVYFTNVKVFGVDGVTDSQVSTLVDDLLDDIPTTILPAGAAYRDVSGVTTALANLAGRADWYPSDYMDEVLKDVQYDLIQVPRVVSDKWFPVWTLQAWPTTPAYEVRLWEDGVDDGVLAPALSELANGVRVLYSDEDGRTAYVDTSDSSDDNYLNIIGLDRMHTLRAGASATSAATICTAYLEGLNFARGKCDIDRPIMTDEGRLVKPYDVEPCQLVRFHRRGMPPITGRIDEVQYQGEHHASIHLGDGSDRLEVVVAEMTKPAVKASKHKEKGKR